MPVSTQEATVGLFRLAQRTPFNIAPERGEKLANEIFGTRKWSLNPSATAANFYAIPAEAKLYLSYAGLASLWALSHVAFNVMDVASRHQREDKKDGQDHIDIGEYFAALRLGEYAAYARSLFHADAAWPINLAKPNIEADFNSVDGRINNLFFGALSWIILHEIAHVHHGDQLLIPKNLRVNQEFQADDFATRWILDAAGTGLKREFRVLMIAVALTWLFLNESEVGRGANHPPAILRFREAVALFNMGSRSPGLENAASVLKAILDPKTPPPISDTPRDSFEWVSGRLEELFPPS